MWSFSPLCIVCTCSVFTCCSELQSGTRQYVIGSAIRLLRVLLVIKYLGFLINQPEYGILLVNLLNIITLVKISSQTI
ncbi:hypothetical protein VNO78_03491 [Psophocarpus tetragonolobus]|uniref:Secreted protein n=1 Tax=Psophocarpus tetragonolobus TaxID=3891 RepID=A0AAN9T2C1_PSOTE